MAPFGACWIGVSFLAFNGNNMIERSRLVLRKIDLVKKTGCSSYCHSNRRPTGLPPPPPSLFLLSSGNSVDAAGGDSDDSAAASAQLNGALLPQEHGASVRAPGADAAATDDESEGVATSSRRTAPVELVELQRDQDPFLRAMAGLKWPAPVQREVLDCLRGAGLWNDDDDGCAQGGGNGNGILCSSSEALMCVCRDYPPTMMARMLMDDFGIEPLAAHRVRAATVRALELEEVEDQSRGRDRKEEVGGVDDDKIAWKEPSSATSLPGTVASEREEEEERPKSFKSVVVNDAAKARMRKRRGGTSSTSEKKKDRANSKCGSEAYGLPKDCRDSYPSLARDLENFYKFMTQPSLHSQEDPIRDATAKVYLTHARLFLGWYVNVRGSDNSSSNSDSENTLPNDLSLRDVVPNKEKESASSLIDFILWMRSERSISHSYEANLLRGLTKLLKFRFCRESDDDGGGSGGFRGATYNDVPVVNELRKLHRIANRKQAKAPRSSNEEKKWISWVEYLNVVQSLQREVQRLLTEYNDKTQQLERHVDPADIDELPLPVRRRMEGDDGSIENTQPSEGGDGGNTFEEVTSQERQIAVTLQKYLVLSVFANVPDRQRTVRELELGRTFLYETGSGCWCIRHAPEDYKTGKAYGERPPMHLPPSLSPAINSFISDWRPCLRPKTNFLFVQPKTGKPLTRDSVYQIVCRACYEHTGKRTNPHLLRDMIVTHVRESNSASEQELEALALFMGHSLNMQRTSYDRRTLSQKVEPAVRLMEEINKKRK